MQRIAETSVHRDHALSSFMHIHLVALRYFSATVRCGSMRQAAESLNISASAVNRQILKLEDQLRTKLFARMAEGVRLTAAGEVLYRHILRLERDLETAVTEIDDLRGLRRGRVTVACEDGIARDFLPAILSDFHRAHPGVTYSIEIARSNAILASVLDGEIDIGIAMFPPDRDRLVIVAETRLPLGVITALDHPMAGRAFVKPTDLMDEALIQMKGGIGGDPELHPMMDRWISGRSFVETNTSDSMTNLVKAGLGIGIRTPIGIMREIEARELAFIPLRDSVQRAGRLAVFIRAQRALPNAGALLLEYLKRAAASLAVRIEPLFGADHAPPGEEPRRRVAASATPR